MQMVGKEKEETFKMGRVVLSSYSYSPPSYPPFKLTLSLALWENKTMKPLLLESFLGWAKDEDPITITKKELFEYFEAILETMEWDKNYGRIKKLREKCCNK